MPKVSRLRRSRDSWKSKAVERAEQLRESRKATARDCQRIASLQAQVATLEQQLAQEKKAPPPVRRP
jgi:hypothetical protein